MGMRATLAFWAFLAGIAVWQSGGVQVATPEKVQPAVVAAPVAQAPRRVALPPRAPRSKFDLSEYTQNTEFFLGKPQNEAGSVRDMSGRSGPYDSEGKLIFPIDLRKMN